MPGEQIPPVRRGIRRRRVTIIEVAKRAGVSKSTAALAFMPGPRSPHISADTHEHVRRVAAEMGYIPSRLGEAFLRGRSGIVGAVIRFSPVVPWIEGVLAVQDELTRAGYVPITLSPTAMASPSHGADGKPPMLLSEIGCIRRLLEYQIDGLIYFAANPEQIAEVMPKVKRHRIPTVTVSQPSGQEGMDFVAVDEKSIGRLAARHLLSLGERTFVTVEYETDYTGVAARRDAFIAELARAGKTCERVVMVSPDQEELNRQLSTRFRPPISVFAVDDTYAAMTVNAVLAHGWRVPEDVAVVGMGDSLLSSHNSLPLATIIRHSAKVGRKAVEMLLDRLQGYNGPSRNVLVRPHLKVRLSALPDARSTSPGSKPARNPRTKS